VKADNASVVGGKDVIGWLLMSGRVLLGNGANGCEVCCCIMRIAMRRCYGAVLCTLKGVDVSITYGINVCESEDYTSSFFGRLSLLLLVVGGGGGGLHS
jgi:hypothetical protein